MIKLSFIVIIALILTFANFLLFFVAIKLKAKSTSREMFSYMNESVDPCDDFYEFACGNGPENVLSTLFYGTYYEVFEMLKDASAINTEVEKMVMQFYKSCENIQNFKKDLSKSLKALIREFGEMPALIGDRWDETQFDWVEVVGRIAYKYGVFSLVSFEIYPVLTNGTINTLNFGMPEFQLKTSHTARDRDDYRKRITKDLTMFLNLDEELATKTANNIVQFEASLEKGLIYKVRSLAEYSELIIHMDRLVNLTMGKAINDSIYKYDMKYHINLKKILEITPKRTVANYVFYNLLASFTQRLTEIDDGKNCTRITITYFSKILDNIIYRRYSRNAIENEIMLLWQKMKTTFKKTLKSDQMDWIRKETRQYVLEKLDAMKFEINSYPTENFAEKFGELVLTDNDFVKNLATIFESKAKTVRERLYKPINSRVWDEPNTFSPQINYLENRITVPVYFLKPYYLWANGNPNAVKFGSLASVIGHELIHGFDDKGRKYNKDGNIKDCWDELSAASFVTRTQCFVNQYSNYTYNGHKLNGKKLLSENIADNGGVNLAYAAYLDWYEEAVRTNQKLSLETFPTLKYTSKQLFFISYAQLWCNNEDPKVRDEPTTTDPHSPMPLRVIGPLSNSPEFAKEFNCAASKPMNPNNKCKIY